MAVALIFQGMLAQTHFHRTASAAPSDVFELFVVDLGGADHSPSPDGSDLDCPICHDLGLASVTVLPDGGSLRTSLVPPRAVFEIVEGDRAGKAAAQFAQRPRGPPPPA